MSRWGAILLAAAFITPQFVKAAEAEDKTTDKPLFRFIAMSDPHLRSSAINAPKLKGYAKFLQEIKALDADFLVILGDVCGEERTALAEIKQVGDESGYPIHYISGNHDDDDGREPDYYEKAMGPFCYSFEHKGWYFVSHWSQKPQYEWLEAELAKMPEGAPIIFWQHYALKKRDKDILGKYNVKLAMSGHFHSYRTGDSDPIRQMTVMIFDTGFAVVDVYADQRVKIEWREREIFKSLQVIEPANGAEVVGGESVVSVNAFDSYRDVLKVEADVGNGPQQLHKESSHSWSAPLKLSGNEGQIVVTAYDSKGERWPAVTNQWRAAATAAVQVKTGAEWPNWGGAVGNRRNSGDNPQPPLRLAWHTALGGRLRGPILADGKIFVTVTTQDFEENNAIVGLDAASGKQLWRAPLKGSPMCAPAYTEGVVGVADCFDRGYGVDAANGNQLWLNKQVRGTFSSYNHIAMVSAASGVIYAGNLNALDAKDGTLLWRTQVAQVGCSPPAIMGDLLLGCGVAYQVMLDRREGKELWRSKPSTYRANILLEDRALINGRFVKKLEDGSMLRELKFRGTGSDSAVSLDGKLLIGCEGGNAKMRLSAIALDDDSVLWTWPKSGVVRGLGAPTVTPEHVWFMSNDNHLRALSLADGSEKWSFEFGARMADPIVSGNTLFIAGDDGCVYAFTGAK